MLLRFDLVLKRSLLPFLQRAWHQQQDGAGWDSYSRWGPLEFPGKFMAGIWKSAGWKGTLSFKPSRNAFWINSYRSCDCDDTTTKSFKMMSPGFFNIVFPANRDFCCLMRTSWLLSGVKPTQPPWTRLEALKRQFGELFIGFYMWDKRRVWSWPSKQNHIFKQSKGGTPCLWLQAWTANFPEKNRLLYVPRSLETP